MRKSLRKASGKQCSEKRVENSYSTHLVADELFGSHIRGGGGKDFKRSPVLMKKDGVKKKKSNLKRTAYLRASRRQALSQHRGMKRYREEKESL